MFDGQQHIVLRMCSFRIVEYFDVVESANIGQIDFQDGKQYNAAIACKFHAEE